MCFEQENGFYNAKFYLDVGGVGKTLFDENPKSHVHISFALNELSGITFRSQSD